MPDFDPSLRRKVRAIVIAALGSKAPAAVDAVERHFGRMLDVGRPQLIESGDAAAPHLTLLIPVSFQPDGERPPLLDFVSWTIHGAGGHVVRGWQNRVRGNPADLARLRDAVDRHMEWTEPLLPSAARNVTSLLPDPAEIGSMLRGPVGDRTKSTSAGFSMGHPFGIALQLKALAAGGPCVWRAPVRGRLSLRPGPDDQPDHVTARFRRFGAGQNPGSVATAQITAPPAALRLLGAEARALVAADQRGDARPPVARSVQPGEVIAELAADSPFWMVEEVAAAAEFELMELFHHAMRPLLVDGLRRFRSALDAAALRAMKPLGISNIATYNWLTAAGDAARSVRRRQALEAWPELMVASGDLLSPVIDAEEPLVEKGAKLLGTSAAVVRATRGLTVTGLEAAEKALPPLPDGLYQPRIAVDLAESMVVAAGLDPRLLPSTGKAVSRDTQWVAFGRQRLAHSVLDAYPVIHPFPAFSPSAIARYRATQIARDPPLWQSETGLRRLANLLPAIRRGGEVFRSFHRHVLAPPLATALARDPLAPRIAADGAYLRAEDGAPLAVERLAGCGDITVLAGLCETFADLEPALSDMLAVAAVGGAAVHWLPLTPPFAVTVNGEPMTVTPLVTAGALVTEGRAMRHCVATYVKDCLIGNGHIVSVAGPSGRLSTVELRLENGKVEVAQHRGLCNSPAPRAAQVALAAYLEALANGALGFDAAALEQALSERRQRNVPQLESEFGFNMADTVLCDVLFDLFRPLLPQDERALSRSDYLARHAVTQTLALRLLAFLETPNGADGFGEQRDAWNRAQAAVVRLFEDAGWPLPVFDGRFRVM